jgi:uncharacterized protein YhfF
VKFKPEIAHAVLRGDIRVTRRLHRHHQPYRVGGTYQVERDGHDGSIGALIVERVELATLAAVTDQDARAEGYTDIGDMLDSWLSRYRRWDLDEPVAVLTIRPDRNATALYLRRRPGRPLAREGDTATSDYTTDPTLAAPNTGQVVTVDELDRSWRDRAAARHDEATSDKRALSEQLAELERRHHAAGLDLPFEVRTAIRRKISVARRRIDDMGAGTP